MVSLLTDIRISIDDKVISITFNFNGNCIPISVIPLIIEVLLDRNKQLVKEFVKW